TGFTDSVGSDDYNLALSKRRAESVAAYLKAHGLKTDSMTVSGRGKADPVASNATPEGRASNRRVEIRLQH
ncbi:OmpA family protein, partial [Burkholderia cenocepacia]|uniref:OmpA family protein n=2 Tax=Burkholderia TaxID=32008 RepID=UPI00128E096D